MVLRMVITMAVLVIADDSDIDFNKHGDDNDDDDDDDFSKPSASIGYHLAWEVMASSETMPFELSSERDCN